MSYKFQNYHRVRSENTENVKVSAFPKIKIENDEPNMFYFTFYNFFVKTKVEDSEIKQATVSIWRQ